MTEGERAFLPPITETSVDASSSSTLRNSAMIIFSTSLSKSLSALRLAPTYIGVTRVRPPSADSTLSLPKTLLTHDINDDEETIRKKQRLVAVPKSDTTVVDIQTNLDDTTPTLNTTTNNNNNGPHVTEEEKVSSKAVVYKVIGEDGKERRMTTREKKEYKSQLALQKKKDKLAITTPLSRERPKNSSSSSSSTDLLPLLDHHLSSETGNDNNNQRKRPLKQQQQQQQIDATATTAAALEEEEELAFLERCRVPPVMLSAAMINIPSITKSFLPLLSSSHAVGKERLVPYGSTANKNSNNIEVDDALAQLWATKIQGQINIAEQLRSQEPIRPMAYTIVPEVWTRMRPVSTMVTQSTNYQTTSSANANDSKLISSPEDVYARYTTIHTDHTFVETNMYTKTTKCIDLLRDTNRTEDTNNHDDDDDTNNLPYYITSMGKLYSNENDAKVEDNHCIIFNHLYDRNLHISCGAKFGCDFLLYDGPREERHAFAGLRILTPNTFNSTDQEQSQLPIPSPYDLAGFVRCLNTAGKLALLATVIRTNSVCKYKDNDGSPTTCGSRENVVKVVFVELVLEKNLTAPTHQRKSTRKSNSKRKEIGKNLAKKKTHTSGSYQV